MNSQKPCRCLFVDKATAEVMLSKVMRPEEWGLEVANLPEKTRSSRLYLVNHGDIIIIFSESFLVDLLARGSKSLHLEDDEAQGGGTTIVVIV